MPLLIRSAATVLACVSLPVCASARPLRSSRSAAAQQTNASSSAGDSSASGFDAAAGPAHPEKHSRQQEKKKKKLPNAPQPTQNPQGISQSKRMMWVVPNFAAVSPGVKFHPLSPEQKFWTATEDSFDYSSFVWTGVLAAQSYGLDQYPELGRGLGAYGGYYWRGLLDGVSNSYFSEAIVPVLTHEDPRYFTMGHGGFFRRLGYAVSRVVITKSDSGRDTFNISEVGGDYASAALSNAYYPPQERGFVKTTEGWGTQLESAALNNIAKEFWPDIRKDLFHQH